MTNGTLMKQYLGFARYSDQQLTAYRYGDGSWCLPEDTGC